MKPYSRRVRSLPGRLKAAHEGLKEQHTHRPGQPAEGAMRQRREHDQPLSDSVAKREGRGDLVKQIAGQLRVEQHIEAADQRVAAGLLLFTYLGKLYRPEVAHLDVPTLGQEPLAVGRIEQRLLDVGDRRVGLAGKHEQGRLA
jgi:hypothetical protein